MTWLSLFQKYWLTTSMSNPDMAKGREEMGSLRSG